MKKGVKTAAASVISILILLAAVYLTVFILAKQKKIFINRWFMDEKNSTIGVDVSSYQAEIDMDRLKEQKIAFIYTPLDWNYKDDWYIWQYLSRGVLEGYTGGEKYIDLNVLNREKKLEDLLIP